MKEKLQEYALLAEIVSAFAIVASLIFVGFQVQQGSEQTAQNTRSIELNAYQDLISQLGQLNSLVLENPRIAELRVQIKQNETPKTLIEREQAFAYMILVIRHGDMAFRQYKNGLIDESSLKSVLGPVGALLPTPIGNIAWSDLSTNLDPQYVSYINVNYLSGQ